MTTLPPSKSKPTIKEDVDGYQASRYEKIAIKSVIDGRRDVGYIELTQENSPRIIKHNLGVIPVRMTSQKSMMAIIYRDKTKALKLYNIAQSHHGYISDRNPEEAREIGRLLGYTEESIKKYIHDKYGKPPPLRIDTADDYNDIDERALLRLNEDYQFGEIKHLMKKII